MTFRAKRTAAYDRAYKVPLNQIAADRVVLLVCHFDLGTTEERDAVPTERPVQILLESTPPVSAR